MMTRPTAHELGRFTLALIDAGRLLEDWDLDHLPPSIRDEIRAGQVHLADLAHGLTDAVAHMDEIAAERREQARIETCEERDYNTPERNPDV